MRALAAVPIIAACSRVAEPSVVVPREDVFAAWKCRCEDGRDTGCARVDAALVVAPRCAAYTDVATEARDRGIDVAVAGDGAAAEVDVSARRRDGLVVMQDVERAREGSSWRAHVPTFTTRGVDNVRIVVRNATDEPTRLVDVRIADDRPAPPRAVGALLFAEHHSELTIDAGPAKAEFWAPLPAMHASQVPLHVAIETVPADVAYRFVAHDDANWGVIFEFPPSTAAHDVVLGWRAVVLTQHVWPDERPRVYAARDNVEIWLEPTVVADTNDDVVKDVARSIAPADAAPLAKLERLLAFTTTGLAPDDDVDRAAAPDATTTAAATLRGRKRDPISCTGFATTTTALGRALGLPTRYVAGYKVGEQMQTHAIAELWLGRDLGWRRIEPQIDTLAIAEDYLVVVRVAHPADEGPEAMAPHRISVQGLPLYAVIENLAAPERLQYHDETTYFDGCPRCNNRASRLAVLEDVDGTRLHAAFGTASASWGALRHALVSGDDRAIVMQGRDASHAVRDLAGLEKLLAE